MISPLLLAPGVSEPWTEGRKVLVRDIHSELTARGFKCSLVTGVTGGGIASGWAKLKLLFRTLSELSITVRSGDVDHVIAFPYGRFSGLRGLVTFVHLYAAKRICQIHDVRFSVFLYSADGINLVSYFKRFGSLVAAGYASSYSTAVPVGIPPMPVRWKRKGSCPSNFLFMAGFQEASRESFDLVLFERGLSDLLDALAKISDFRIQLTIAVPFLRDPEMWELMEALLKARCPDLKYRLEYDIIPIDELLKADAFVFPYKKPHSVFIPHSILEAMSLGVPLIAADHDMYSSLTLEGLKPRCLLYRPNDIEGLASAVRHLSDDYDRAVSLAENAGVYVRENWNISRCVDLFIEAVDTR